MLASRRAAAGSLLLVLLGLSCRPWARRDSLGEAPPAFLLGDFEDDYGNRFTITGAEWWQRPRNRFHVVRWQVTPGYLIARNDPANAGDRGLWTRIDWMPLDGMAPYEWAFCFSAYNASSAAAAESTQIAVRATPRTGCNGFPFTRMRRVRSDGVR